MTDKNYKMNKLTKIMLASIVDSNYRGVVSSLFKEAEYHAEHARKKMSIKVTDTDKDD